MGRGGWNFERQFRKAVSAVCFKPGVKAVPVVCFKPGVKAEMKKQFILNVLMICLGAELLVLLFFAVQDVSGRQDAVAVNEVLHNVQNDWGHMERHLNQTALDYVVLDMEGDVVFCTKTGLSESVNQAVIHRDTILDVYGGGIAVGKLLIYNNTKEVLLSGKRTAFLVLGILIAVQTFVYIWYIVYLERNVIRPFQKMKDFARRVAGGNLDVPLEMDRHNLFGAFTESFDIMRAELKKARKAEAEANAAKKELVAKLSHDIKTPIASIQAAAEVGAVLAERVSGTEMADGGGRGQNAALEGIRENYLQIMRKAEQIGTLVTNLFTATLEELEQLTVSPADMEGYELEAILRDADYLGRANVPDIPAGLLYADRLRLQQVFDNIFVNSYKYADTQIKVAVRRQGRYLAVETEDYGGGVGREELPLLKEKFRRGSNAAETEGAGLGLYISDYFMKEMQGEIHVENGEKGLKVKVLILLSGMM